jgi:hypothetical protein
MADTVDRVADQVAEESPPIADWIRKGASEIGNLSDKLKSKSIGELLTIGKDFAHREPAAFIAASAFAGFALSRLLRSSSAETTATGPAQRTPPAHPDLPMTPPRSAAEPLDNSARTGLAGDSSQRDPTPTGPQSGDMPVAGGSSI